MSLNQAIQFRHLTTQLTHQERICFLSKLVGSHVDIILTSLFQHLSKSNQIDEVSEFNKELSDIIQSRKDKPAPLCTRNIKLDQFPRAIIAIIGYTASFLDQFSYINFSLSNRSTYLGCNSPNTLQELSLSKPKHYSLINVTAFPSVEHLYVQPLEAIKAQHMFSFDASNFNQTTTLTLDANFKHGWVQPFLNQNIVNCDNVTTLDCVQFGHVISKMQRAEFLSLLTKFQNLSHLKIYNVHITEDTTEKDIADLCPNVVGLAITDGRTRANKHLPRIFASQLKYLSLRQHQKNAFDCDKVAFDKLEELCLCWPNNEALNAILKSALHLKQIYITYFTKWMTNDEIQNSIANLMTKRTSLRHVGFSITSPNFGSVLEGIEHSLFKIKTQHRIELKISIKIRKSPLKPNDFIFSVARVINALESCDVDDFMFIWEFSPI
eukprot:721193_1